MREAGSSLFSPQDSAATSFGKEFNGLSSRGGKRLTPAKKEASFPKKEY